MAIILGRKPGGSGGGGAPSGPAGGDLSGTYPNPTLAAGVVDTTELANGAVTAAKVAADVATQAELDAVAATIGLFKVETQTAGAGGVASFDFQAIAGTGNALMITLLIAGETAATNTTLNLRFNNDSGANYDTERLDGQNTTVAGGAVVAGTSALCAEIPAASITPRSCAVTIMVPGYATTTLDKAFTSFGGYSLGTDVSQQGVRSIHGLWRSTVAITRITLTPGAGDIVEGSTATLYRLA